MNASAASKGNDPEKWEKLIDALDQKLQFGLLDYLKRVSAYHFEDEVLFIDPANQADEAYLTKDSNFQQLTLFAQEATGVERIKIKKLT